MSNLFFNKCLPIWFGVNKNGFIATFIDEPIKNMKTGKWEGKYPLVNSLIYPKICELVESANMTFDHEAQYIEFKLT